MSSEHGTPASLQLETQVRKRVLKQFNKCKADFATAREYNDYLEMVEEIIENLLSNRDVRETQERIRAYAEHSRETTAANQGRRIEAERAAASRIAAEEKQREEVARKMREEEEAARAEVRRGKAELEKQLASDKPQAALKSVKKEKRRQQPQPPPPPPPTVVVAAAAAKQPAGPQQTRYRPTTSMFAAPVEVARIATSVPQSVAAAVGRNTAAAESRRMSPEAEMAAGYDARSIQAKDLDEAFGSLWLS